MPKAPYTPNVDVALSGQEIPEFRPTVRPEAFGVNVGQAIEKLGSTFEQAGNQVFNTAVQLQEEHLRTKAMNASTQYYAQTAKARQDFLAAENPGPEGLQKYIKDIGDARDKIRGTIAEPYAQRLYDNETRVDLERAYTAGAVHAASGTRKATQQALQAQEEVYKGRIAEDPKSEEAFNTNLENIRGSIRERLGPKGMQAEQTTINAAIEKAEQEAKAGRIKSLMRSDVPAAIELADRYKGQLGIHTEETLRLLQQEDHQVGTRMEADNIMAPIMEKQKAGVKLPSEEDAVKQIKDVADKTHPNDPLWGQLAEISVRTKYRAFQTQIKNSERDAVATIDDIMSKHPEWTSVEQIRSLPEGDQALKVLGSKLGPIELQHRIDRVHLMNDEHDNTEADRALGGLMQNRPEDFLDADLTSYKQTPANYRKWRSIRERFRKEQGTDPRLSAAMNWLRPSGVLESLGLYKRTENNKDEYDNFTGLVAEAIHDFKTVHGHDPTQQEFMDKVKPGIMQQIPVWRHNWIGRALNLPDKEDSDKIWKTEPDDQFKIDMQAQEMARGGPELTEEQVRRAWFLNQYQRVIKGEYKKK
jgi:hypothetical protein